MTYSPSQYIDPISGQDWTKDKIETLQQQLAEAQKLVRFWEHQHSLDMNLLKENAQRIATLEEKNASLAASVEMYREDEMAYTHMKAERDRLQAQVDEAKWLIENSVSDGLVARWEWNKRQISWMWPFRTEKKEP